MEINKKIKYLSISIICSLLLALYIFGYLFTYLDTNFLSFLRDNEGNRKKDYSISFSLANGNKIGLTLFFTVGFFLFICQLFHKFKNKNLKYIYYFINFLILIIYSLIISMIYYSPLENKAKNFNNEKQNEHSIVALISFTFNLILNMLITYLLFYKNDVNNNKIYFYILILLQIIFYLSLIIDIDYRHHNKTNNYKDNYFPVAENINFLFIILSVALLSFKPLKKSKIDF